MDQIANMLSSIKNAGLVKRDSIVVPHSTIKASILEVLKSFNEIHQGQGNRHPPQRRHLPIHQRRHPGDSPLHQRRNHLDCRSHPRIPHPRASGHRGSGGRVTHRGRVRQRGEHRLPCVPLHRRRGHLEPGLRLGGN